MLLRACGIQQLAFAVSQPVRQLQVVGMVLVGQPQRRQSPIVLHIGIDRETVVFDWQRRAMSENFERAREVVSEQRLESLAPAWAARWRSAECIYYWGDVYARGRAAG